MLQGIGYVLSLFFFTLSPLRAKVANLVMYSIDLIDSLIMIPWESKNLEILYVTL